MATTHLPTNVNRQRDMTENITFPHLRWRAVIKRLAVWRNVFPEAGMLSDHVQNVERTYECLRTKNVTRTKNVRNRQISILIPNTFTNTGSDFLSHGSNMADKKLKEDPSRTPANKLSVYVLQFRRCKSKVLLIRKGREFTQKHILVIHVWMSLVPTNYQLST